LLIFVISEDLQVSDTEQPPASSGRLLRLQTCPSAWQKPSGVLAQSSDNKERMSAGSRWSSSKHPRQRSPEQNARKETHANEELENSRRQIVTVRHDLKMSPN
jgi:hypothetical protein